MFRNTDDGCLFQRRIYFSKYYESSGFIGVNTRKLLVCGTVPMFQARKIHSKVTNPCGKWRENKAHPLPCHSAITSPSTRTKEGGSRDIKRNCINRNRIPLRWKQPSGQEGPQWDRIFIPAQRSGKGGTNSMPSPTRILHIVSIAAQQQTFFPFHKKAWLTLCNYISQRFNQILSSLELAILFLLISSFCNVPKFSSRMEQLRVFFSIQGCPSAATVLCCFVPPRCK